MLYQKRKEKETNKWKKTAEKRPIKQNRKIHTLKLSSIWCKSVACLQNFWTGFSIFFLLQKVKNAMSIIVQRWLHELLRCCQKFSQRLTWLTKMGPNTPRNTPLMQVKGNYKRREICYSHCGCYVCRRHYRCCCFAVSSIFRFFSQHSPLAISILYASP